MRELLVALLSGLIFSLNANASEGVGGVLRTGPTFSETTPNWRLGISFDYAFERLSVGTGIDLVVSQKHYVDEDQGELRLNLFGFFAEGCYTIVASKEWEVGLGATVGARTVAYENASNNSFNPTDWIPVVPDSPLGSTMHFVLCPFGQLSYKPAQWVEPFARLTYDIHVGPDYEDVSARSLSGLGVQLGVRLMMVADH